MFLNLILLTGIAGAAVPLALHLRGRSRHRRVAWGAMMFLTSQNSRQQRAIQLRQWVLLAIRMLLVILLAIALARPVVRGKTDASNSNNPVTAVILFDNSASMTATFVGHSRLELARAAARQILASLRPGDRAALLLLAGHQSRQPLSDAPIADPLLIERQLLETTIESGVADIADGLRRAADCLDRSPPSPRELFIIADRQAVNWRNVTDVMAKGWVDRIIASEGLSRFAFIPIGSSAADNIAIESLAPSAWPMLVNQPTRFEAVLRDFGPRGRTDVHLTLLVDDRPAATRVVNLLPNLETAVSLSIALPSAGSHLITARIDAPVVRRGDGFLSGQEFSYAVDAIPPLKALVIREDLAGQDVSGRGAAHAPGAGGIMAADYLTLALAPFAAMGQPGSDLAVTQTVTASTRPGSAKPDLASSLADRDTRVAILDGIAQLTAAQATSIQRFVGNGGGLLIAPGVNTDVENLNSALGAGGVGIMPATLKPAAAAPVTSANGNPGLAYTSIAANSLQVSHPAFSFLRARPDAISQAAVYRFFPTLVVGKEASILARYATGEPFVLAGQFGRGRVLLMTTPLDPRWNTLPLTNLFLPLVQGMIRYLAAYPNRNLQINEPILARFEATGANESAAEITLPNGVSRPLSLVARDQTIEARFAETSEPGVYTISRGSAVSHFVVVPPREEFDLAPLPDDLLRKRAAQLGFTVVEPAQSPREIEVADLTADPSVIIEGHRHPRELWIWLLSLVIILGVLELGLARWWSPPPAANVSRAARESIGRS